MSAPHADTILGGYRRRLEEELQQLPRSRREEIIAEFEAHIRDARAAYPAETDADLLNLLDRLGDPGIIGADARQRFDVVELAPVGLREVIALLLLLAGPFVIPVVSGILGGLLVRSSVSWTAGQKRNAMVWSPVVTLGLLLGLIVLINVIGVGDSSTSVVVIGHTGLFLVFFVVTLTPVVAGLVLAWALARRGRQRRIRHAVRNQRARF